MSAKIEYKCDVCKKPITGGHQEYYKAKIVITYRYSTDGCGGTEDDTKVYHVHNDLTNHCMRKLWKILEGHSLAFELLAST